MTVTMLILMISKYNKMQLLGVIYWLSVSTVTTLLGSLDPRHLLSLNKWPGNEAITLGFQFVRLLYQFQSWMK